MEPVQKGSGRLPLLFFQELLCAQKYGNVAHDPFDAVPGPLTSGLAAVTSRGLNLEQPQRPLSAAPPEATLPARVVPKRHLGTANSRQPQDVRIGDKQPQVLIGCPLSSLL